MSGDHCCRVVTVFSGGAFRDHGVAGLRSTAY
jgi:hypothetical protein